MHLYDADTDGPIGPASWGQECASDEAAERDGGAGIIRIDSGGFVVEQQDQGRRGDLRRVYAGEAG